MGSGDVYKRQVVAAMRTTTGAVATVASAPAHAPQSLKTLPRLQLLPFEVDAAVRHIVAVTVGAATAASASVVDGSTPAPPPHIRPQLPHSEGRATAVYDPAIVIVASPQNGDCAPAPYNDAAPPSPTRPRLQMTVGDAAAGKGEIVAADTAAPAASAPAPYDGAAPPSPIRPRLQMPCCDVVTV